MPAMTPAEVRAAREALGLTQEELATALEIEGEHGKDTVRRWESGRRPIQGPARVALRYMLADRRLLAEAAKRKAAA